MRTRAVGRWVAAALWVLLTAGAALALDPDETDPRAIMQAVQGRDDGDRRTSRIRLTVTDVSGRSLRRTVQARTQDFAEGTRSLILFESPADVRNTGLLTIDFGATGRNADQWLYLPSLHTSTRISSSDRSDSFLGTDLSYADMTSRNVEGYEYALLSKSEEVDGDDCWVIESRPDEREARETGYAKSHLWVSKSKRMVVQAKNWVKEGRKIKYIKLSDFQKIDGIWVAQRLVVRVLKADRMQSQTTLDISDIRFDQDDVQESDFTQRRLEQGL